MKYDTPFASRFKALREKIGVSQSEMAERLGISQQSVSFYEKGDRLPDYYVLNRICEETGCSIRYLFGYQEAMSDYGDEFHKDLGLSDEALHFIRSISVEEKEIFDNLLRSTAFEVLLHVINYTISLSGSQTDPVSKSFEWDRGAFMCSRVFDDVMDEQFDRMLALLPPEERAKYNIAIEQESRERENSGVWAEKVKLHPVQYNKDRMNPLMRFKHFRTIMQDIEQRSHE